VVQKVLADCGAAKGAEVRESRPAQRLGSAAHSLTLLMSPGHPVRVVGCRGTLLATICLPRDQAVVQMVPADCGGEAEVKVSRPARRLDSAAHSLTLLMTPGHPVWVVGRRGTLLATICLPRGLAVVQMVPADCDAAKEAEVKASRPARRLAMGSAAHSLTQAMTPGPVWGAVWYTSRGDNMSVKRLAVVWIAPADCGGIKESLSLLDLEAHSLTT
jgi:hypothetical protein